jgi:hypothetical protein
LADSLALPVGRHGHHPDLTLALTELLGEGRATIVDEGGATDDEGFVDHHQHVRLSYPTCHVGQFGGIAAVHVGPGDGFEGGDHHLPGGFELLRSGQAHLHAGTAAATAVWSSDGDISLLRRLTMTPSSQAALVLAPMDDNEIRTTIDELVAEEHELRTQHQLEPLDEARAARLRELEESLDQCWDLLRQRRARREFGLDPDEVQPRDTSVVEHYRQ